MTRREAIRLCGALSAGAWISGRPASLLAAEETVPPRAPGAPMSPERRALIDAFQQKSDGLEKAFESRSYKDDWTMPYRLFRPATTAKVPLVLYLHGSGDLGDDNVKQMGLGNIFGTRVWALPENQKNFPCYVVAPQTDRGWARYDQTQEENGSAKVVPGLGDGARLALAIVDRLCRDFPIDQKRIYVTGQSMGGAGTWNVTAHRTKFFAAQVICCGSRTAEDVTMSADTPLWSFQGDADKTVPVALSRDRIAALRKAGARPLYSEYAGVDHNVWEWAYTEPALVKWVFSQHRG
jgi:predicted peptidase